MRQLVKALICLVILVNDTRENIVTTNIITQCTCSTRADTLSHQHRPTHPKSHKYCRVLLPVFTRLGVFLQLHEENGGRREIVREGGVGCMLELAG